MRSWTNSRPPGLTLIELLAALAILGTLLASVIVAKGQFVHQWRLGRDKAEAVRLADDLLTQWRAEAGPGVTLAPATEGELPRGWRWEVEQIQPAGLEGWGAELATLRVFGPTRFGTEAQVLTQVQWFVPPSTPAPATATPTEVARAAF